MISYNWFKVHHGITSDPKWRAIARKIHIPEGTIVSVWVALLEYGSQQEERGDVQGFSCADYDCCYGYEDGTCQTVYEALVQRGLIVDDFITNWERRQSQPETTSTAKTPRQRTAECRARKKQELLSQQNECNDCNGCNDCNERNVTCNDVTTEEKRGDEIREEEIRTEENTPQPPKGEAPAQRRKRSSSSTPERADDWECWYAAYPRHDNKQSAIKAWNKAHKEGALPSIETLLAALAWQKPRWTDPQFIPMPSTYLNGRRWQDERPAVQAMPNTSYAFPQNGRLDGMARLQHNMAVAQQVLAELDGKPATRETAIEALMGK